MNQRAVTISGSDRSDDLYAQPVEWLAAADRSELQVNSCPVCQCRQACPVMSFPGLPFQLVVCRDCGLGRLWPEPTPQEIQSFYPRHYYGSEGRKFLGLIERLVRVVGARHARFFARQMPPGGRVLDVGCGRGVTLGALASLGYQPFGFEVSHDAVIGVDPQSEVRVAETLSAAAFPADYFDEVIMWHVFEHVADPADTLREVRRIMKPGGILIIAVPNFSSWQARLMRSAWFHLDPPRHLFHFPLPAFSSLICHSGFRIRSEHHFSLRQNPFGWIQSIQNTCSWLPRNGLYVLLHRLQDRDRRFRMWARVQLWILCVLCSPLALILSALEAVCRQGATVHVVATRLSDADAAANPGVRRSPAAWR